MEKFREKFLIIRAFCRRSQYELITVNIPFVIVHYSVIAIIHLLLYNERIISKKYHNNGKIEISDSLLRAVFSFIIGFVLYKVYSSIHYYFLIDTIINESNNSNEYGLSMKTILKHIHNRLFWIYTGYYIIILFLFYYSNVFCYLYQYTQYKWIIETAYSELLLLVLSLVFSFIFSTIKIISLHTKCAYCILNLYFIIISLIIIIM